eukprot:14398775-Heterocapsa_arctica.AAC.1
MLVSFACMSARRASTRPIFASTKTITAFWTFSCTWAARDSIMEFVLSILTIMGAIMVGNRVVVRLSVRA